MTAENGGVCQDCGHQHAGDAMGGICVGCACPERSDAWLADLATSTDDGPSQLLIDACMKVSRGVAELLAIAEPLLRPSEIDVLNAARSVAHSLPWDDR